MSPRYFQPVVAAAFAFAAAVALLSAPALAEVRLEPPRGAGTSTVEIILTPDGPWTVRGELGSQTLNPGGDLLGDGFPATTTRGQAACVAWFRFVDERLLLACGTDAVWQESGSIPATAAVGTPGVASSTDESILATWTSRQSDGLLQAELAVQDANGEWARHALDEGSLIVDTVTLAGTATAVVAVASPTGEVELVLASGIKPPNEPPLVRRRHVAWVSTGDRGLAEAIVTLAPRIHVLPEASEAAAILTWWTIEDALAYALIGADGSVLAVDTLRKAPNRNASERALLRHVMRASNLKGADGE